MLLDLIIVASLTLMSVTVLAATILCVSIAGYVKASRRRDSSFAPVALIVIALFAGLIFIGSLTLSNISFGSSETSQAIEQIDDGGDSKVVSDNDVANEPRSFIAWFRAGLNDLGLGFGWAAVYFSVCIAWFNGQTLGKMLFGIRVVKIDHQPITLWESFERYGGYTAGIATGLLGFAQIIWDPNRQAIHDKISMTLVINLRKADRVVSD